MHGEALPLSFFNTRLTKAHQLCACRAPGLPAVFVRSVAAHDDEVLRSASPRCPCVM